MSHYMHHSTGARDRSFYPIFNKRFHHIETLLTIRRPKKVLSGRSLCRPLVPSSQSKCPKRSFILPQKYHVSQGFPYPKIGLSPTVLIQKCWFLNYAVFFPFCPNCLPLPVNPIWETLLQFQICYSHLNVS